MGTPPHDSVLLPMNWCIRWWLDHRASDSATAPGSRRCSGCCSRRDPDRVQGREPDSRPPRPGPGPLSRGSVHAGEVSALVQTGDPPVGEVLDRVAAAPRVGRLHVVVDRREPSEPEHVSAAFAAAFASPVLACSRHPGSTNLGGLPERRTGRLRTDPQRQDFPSLAGDRNPSRQVGLGATAVGAAEVHPHLGRTRTRPICPSSDAGAARRRSPGQRPERLQRRWWRRGRCWCEAPVRATPTSMTTTTISGVRFLILLAPPHGTDGDLLRGGVGVR